jgi:inorganic pyrophosphatase
MTGAERGDGDPLDICVVSERPINHSEFILDARIIGGLPMLDAGEADDKIIAVLDNDEFWSHAQDLGDLPALLVERLRHYFLTYKLTPDRPHSVASGPGYGRAHAHTVIQAAIDDYRTEFRDD